MVVNKKVTGKASSMPAGLAMGGLVSLLMTLLMAACLAKLVDTEVLKEENIGYGVMVLLMASSVLGALTAYGKIKRQRLLVCMLSGAVYMGILLSITALFFGGQYEAVGVTTLLVFGSSMVIALLGLREKRGGNRKKRRGSHR